ncbi:MAG: hypothetical protein M0R46_13865 [Candidatus Muirbacterium halophilum]|nr:hypothetical protein [Candidatus Muirbacterium halophilum]
MSVQRYKEFSKIDEDKIMKFSDYNPTKYNGNKLANQIRDWLLLYKSDKVDHDNSNVQVEDGKVITTVDEFFKESGVDKDIFMTYYNEKDKSRTITNFNIEIEDGKIIFVDNPNTQIEENNETE